MKIVYIAKFKKIWDEEIIAEAFEYNGVKVIRMEDSGIKNDDYIEKIKEEKPDLVLFAKIRVMENSLDLINRIKKLGIKTASWTFDLLIGHPPREIIIDKLNWLKCDYVFLTDGGHTKEYKKKGINKITIRQGIPERFNYIAMKDKGEYDIVFVGTLNPTYPYRQRMLKFLQDTYKNKFKWYGKGNSEEIRGDDLNKLYANSKIIIGDSMYSDNYWSNRIYEVLGRGGFLITPKVKGLEKEFDYYKEMIPYNINDFTGLKEKIDYFLNRTEQREKIAKAGFLKVKNNYLYKHRVKELLEKL